MMKQPPLSWLPQYTIQRSRRAKRMRLSIHPQTGLTLHLPYFATSVDIENLLNEKKSWILKHNHLLQPTPYQEIEPPIVLSLPAITETWQIDYKENCAKPTLFAAGGQRLVIMDTKITLDRSIPLLHRWLKRKAILHLTPWIQNLSDHHQLPFNRLQIRKQKTLWGSCSSQKNIQLNYKLLFLPPHLVTHVLLHELSHTRYLNHGRSFWRLLMNLDANCEEHNRQLREVEGSLPKWLYVELGSDS